MPDLALLYDDLAETYAAGRHRFDTTVDGAAEAQRPGVALELCVVFAPPA